MIGAMIDVTESKQSYDSLKQAYASLNDAYARLQTMSREVQAAEQKERRRLSRELHDEFGQLLSALMFDLNDIMEGLLKIRSPKVTSLRRKIKSAGDQPPVVRPPFKFLHADTLIGTKARVSGAGGRYPSALCGRCVL
jgi:hypothetical protein